jgi:hypothetical protein
MDIVTSFIQILLPGGLVLLGIYATVKTLLENDYQKKALDVRARSSAEVLPLRLQAYERIALLLERTSPHNLVLRVNNPVYTAAQFQQQMVHEIREELNHNLSQQIYISPEAWALTRQAIEETISLINTSAQGLPLDGPSIELARAIFEQLINRQKAPNEDALRVVKEEVASLF